MCRPASFVITKDNVYWSKVTESHEVIIEEHNLKESDRRGNIQFVRIEIVPPHNDYRLPFKKWEYHVDQDILPKWYVAEVDEQRARKTLKDWRRAKVILPNEVRTLKGNDCILVVYGTVESMSGSSTVKSMSGSSTVESMYGSSTVESMYGSSTVKSMSGSSTVKSMSGSSTVESMYGSSTVESMSGSSTVESMYDSSTVCVYTTFDKGVLKSARAVIVDRRKGKAKCYVGS